MNFEAWFNHAVHSTSGVCTSFAPCLPIEYPYETDSWIDPGFRTHSSLLAAAVAFLSRAIPGLLAIYRFGSYGTAQERIDSDIDLAILATQPVESVQRWELAQQLAGLLGRDVDLVDLGASTAVLRAQVISNGERLYCADPARCGTFEDFAYADYARLNEERREILADIQERGSVYGR